MKEKYSVKMNVAKNANDRQWHIEVHKQKIVFVLETVSYDEGTKYGYGFFFKTRLRFCLRQAMA